jgi:hypothetical protein
LVFCQNFVDISKYLGHEIALTLEIVLVSFDWIRKSIINRSKSHSRGSILANITSIQGSTPQPRPLIPLHNINPRNRKSRAEATMAKLLPMMKLPEGGWD